MSTRRCVPCLAVLGFASSVAYAQDPVLEEIVVMAQKREQNAQDVPISLSTIGGDRLLESGVSVLEDVGPYVPNFSMNPTGIASSLAIRGISSGVNQGVDDV
jgi:outer membrane receptor protein involved in Fe transport